MIYIDFPGGAHGHFLEFIILKHINRVPEYQNFLPFTDIGTSHLKKQISSGKTVLAVHYSQRNENITIDPDDYIIRIPVINKDLYLKFIIWGNITLRTGDGTFELSDFEINTLEKLKDKKFEILKQHILYEQGIKDIYPRSYLRNIFYSQIREQDNTYTTFKSGICKILNFEFSNFYSWDSFVKNLQNIAGKLRLEFMVTDTLEADYKAFLNKNSVYLMGQKVKHLFEKITDESFIETNLNILEEAFLNVLITDKFNIHSDIRTFNNCYKVNSIEIAYEIKQILKKRNADFSLEMPIAQQLDKIVLEF